jgi:hypothetical protein
LRADEKPSHPCRANSDKHLRGAARRVPSPRRPKPGVGSHGYWRPPTASASSASQAPKSAGLRGRHP